MPTTVRAHLKVAVLLIGAGLLVLFVPASFEGPVLVPISEGHGLSAVDTGGATLLAAGGTWLEVVLARRLPHLALSARALFALGGLAGVGLGLIVASVFSGFFWWWAIGAGALSVTAAVLVYVTAKR